MGEEALLGPGLSHLGPISCHQHLLQQVEGVVTVRHLSL